jgi:hypothetical protein
MSVCAYADIVKSSDAGDAGDRRDDAVAQSCGSGMPVPAA